MLGVGKAVASNVSAEAHGLFSWMKNMPLFGVTSQGEARIAQGIKNIKAPFSKEFQEARNVLGKEVEAIRGKGGVLETYAKDFNRARGLEGADAITSRQIERDITSSFGQGDDAILAAQRQYGISNEHMERIAGAMDRSQQIAGAYSEAVLSPFRMAKDYALDGSPLAMYAKGAVAFTGFQMATGRRESLTSKGGQSNIAGIPFI
jgi:hypothetical protein